MRDTLRANALDQPAWIRAVARPLILVSIIVGAIYLWWRATSTFHGSNPVLFGVIYVIEVATYVRYVLRALPVALGRRTVATPRWDSQATAMMAIIVTDEAISQVRLAIRSAQEVQRASAVVVVNSHGRQDVRDQAARMRVIELDCAGPRDIGNSIWRLVREARDELLCFVPAYTAIHPDLIRYSAGHFDDDRVGAVTFPVDLVGATGIAGGSGYRLASDADPALAVALDAFGASAALAGPLLCRREALGPISDAPIGAGSLELQIGLELQKRGLIVRVGPMGLARRRAPWSEDRALRDRARLVSSRFSLSHHRSLSTKGLSSGLQRIPYVLAGLDLSAAVMRLVLVLVPPLVATTGLVPFSLAFRSVLLIAVPWYVTAALGRRCLAGVGEPIGSELRRGIRTLPVDLAVLRSRGEQLPGQREAVSWQFRFAVFLVATSAVSAGMPFIGIGPDLTVGLKFVVVGSALLSISLVRDLMWASTDRERRVLGRAPMANFTAADEVLRELSPMGLDVYDDRPFGIGERLEVRMNLPLTARRWWQPSLTAEVKRCCRAQNGYVAYAEFVIDAAAFDELLYFCSVTADAALHVGIALRPVTAVVRILPTGHRVFTSGSSAERVASIA